MPLWVLVMTGVPPWALVMTGALLLALVTMGVPLERQPKVVRVELQRPAQVPRSHQQKAPLELPRSQRERTKPRLQWRAEQPSLGPPPWKMSPEGGKRQAPRRARWSRSRS